MPFLLGRIDYGESDLSKHAAHVLVEKRVLTEPPRRFGLYKTRGYGLVATSDGWLFSAGTARSIEWFERGHR